MKVIDMFSTAGLAGQARIRIGAYDSQAGCAWRSPLAGVE